MSSSESDKDDEQSRDEAPKRNLISNSSDSESDVAERASEPGPPSGTSAPTSPAASPARSDTSSAPSHRSLERAPAKRRNLIGSSDEDEAEDSKATQKAAIFGDDVSSSDDDDAGKKKEARSRSRTPSSGEERVRRSGSEESIHGIRMYPDPDEEAVAEEEQKPVIIETTNAMYNVDVGTEPKFCKLPNFLSVEQKPFDEKYYEDNEDEEDRMDAEGRARLKLKVENTIRWRFKRDAEGNVTEEKESNAKMVRWSDGSTSLYLGNEVFDVQESLMPGHDHLYIRQGSGLIGTAIFAKKIAFRPCSTDSKTHRKVTLNMADRTRKGAQVKVLRDVGSNPETAKRVAIREEEEKLRALMRKEAQTRRKLPSRGLTSSYLEGRDDSDEDSSARMKSRPGKGGRDAPIIGLSSDEDSDGAKRIEHAKLDSDSDEEGGHKQKQQQKKRIVTSDEESD